MATSAPEQFKATMKEHTVIANHQTLFTREQQIGLQINVT